MLSCLDMKKHLVLGLCYSLPFLVLRLIFPDVTWDQVIHESVTAILYIFASYASYYVLTKP